MSTVKFDIPTIPPLKQYVQLRNEYVSTNGDMDGDISNIEELPAMYKTIKDNVTLCGENLPVSVVVETAQAIQDIQTEHKEDSDSYTLRSLDRVQRVKERIEILKSYCNGNKLAFENALTTFTGNTEELKIVLDHYIESSKNTTNE